MTTPTSIAVRAALLVTILTMTGCAAPAPSGSSPAPPSAPPDRPSDSPALVDRAADLRAHVSQAVATEERLIEALVIDAEAGDLAAVRASVQAVADWASGELTWANGLPTDACTATAVAPYRDATSTIALAAIGLSVLLLDTSGDVATPEELERGFGHLDRGHSDLAAAARLVEATSCIGSAEESTTVRFDPAAYLDLARAANDVLRASDTGDPWALAIDEAAALRPVVAYLESSTSDGPLVQAAADAGRSVLTLLGAVAGEASVEDACSAYRLARFGLLDLSAAVDALRESVGLPERDADDYL